MSFERSYIIESHERIKLILIFGDKSLLLTWWVTYMHFTPAQYIWSHTGLMSYLIFFGHIPDLFDLIIFVDDTNSFASY